MFCFKSILDNQSPEQIYLTYIQKKQQSGESVNIMTIVIIKAIIIMIMQYKHILNVLIKQN